MKKHSLAAIVGGAILSVASASASTSNFQFGATGTGGSYVPAATPSATSGNASTFGNGMQFSGGTNGAVNNAWVYAYSNATSSSITGTNFETAQLGQSTDQGTYNGNNPTMPLGLTDCNQKEGTACGSPQHQVDDNMGSDFILINFSSAVNLTSLTLSTYQGAGTGIDSQDFVYAWGTGAFPTIAAGGTTALSNVLNAADHLTSVTCSSFFTSGFACGTGASNTYTSTQGFVGNGATWLMIGADSASANDYFKISDLVVTSTTGGGGSSPAPEPGTFGLIGLGLTGLGIASRKLKFGKS